MSNYTIVFDLTPSSIIFTLLFATTVVGLTSIYIRHRLLEKEISKLTNGIPVKPFSKIIPLIGDLSLIFDPKIYQEQNHSIYGRIFATYFFGEYHIVLQDPSLLDQVYYENAKNIRFEWTESVTNLFGRQGILNAFGDEHKKKRRMVLNYIGVPVLNRLFPGYVQIFNKYITGWIERSKDGTFVDIFPELGNAVWEAISYVVLGDDIPQDMVDELRQVMDTFGKGAISLPVNFSFTTYGKAIAARDRFKELIVKEFKRRRAMPDLGNNRKDFFQTLINETCDEGYPEGFDIDTALTVIYGSFDTTKATSAQMINTMIEHAKEWERVREDVQKAFGDEGILAPDVTYSRLCEETPYIAACVKEVMRWNTFPLGGLRKVVNDFEVAFGGKKYIIPAGSRVYSSHHGLSHDEQSIIFKDAASFIPERFMGSNAEDKVSKYKSSFLQFGVGEKQCPGSPIAKLEVEIIMALMSKYKWIRKERPRDWILFPFPMPSKSYYVKAVPIHQQ